MALSSYQRVHTILHFGSILSEARGTIAPGSMIQSLLRPGCMCLPTPPYFQRRLLDGAGKRKR